MSGERFPPRIAGSVLLALLGLLVVGVSVWSWPGRAQPADASAVVGTYTIRSFTPHPTVGGPDTTSCWGSLAVGQTVTVAEAGSGRLTLTLPSGWFWTLEPGGSRNAGYAAESTWTGTDEDRLVRGATSSLGFTGYLIYVELGYGVNSSSTYCTADLVAEAPYEQGDAQPPADPADSETPSAPSGQQLGVSLGCQHGLGDPGRVECTATPTPAADTYDWTFDGTPQTATTGPELRMSDVPPGSHTVSVIARDTVSGLTSSPDTLTFTTSTRGGGGGPPIATIALGVGALLAGTMAIGLVRRRPRPATAPASVGPPPDSPATAPSSLRPPARTAGNPRARPAPPTGHPTARRPSGNRRTRPATAGRSHAQAPGGGARRPAGQVS